MMNQSTQLIIASLLLIVAAFGVTVAAPIVAAHASGLNNEKNFGQCKQDFPNGNGCVSTVKPGNG